MENYLEIIRFSNRPLCNAEYFRHKTEIIEAIEKSDIHSEMEKIYVPFTTTVDAIDKAMEVISKSIYSEKIWDADKQRDVVTSGLINAVDSATMHFDENIREIGKELQIITKHYKGINKQSIESQTASTVNMLQDLRKKPEYLQTLGFTTWVNEVEILNNNVSELLMSRFDEKASKSGEQVKELRPECDDQLEKVYNAIETFAQLTEAEVYASCIAKINAINKKYIDTIAQRKGISESKEEEEENDNNE